MKLFRSQLTRRESLGGLAAVLNMFRRQRSSEWNKGQYLKRFAHWRVCQVIDWLRRHTLCAVYLLLAIYHSLCRPL